MKIIAADDNESNRILIEKMVRRLGHDIEVVSGGLELVERVVAGAYDLVLADLKMPDLDGIKAVGAIRERRTGGSMPVFVALSGLDERKEFYDAGFDDFLGKPFTMTELQAMVERSAKTAASR